MTDPALAIINLVDDSTCVNNRIIIIMYRLSIRNFIPLKFALMLQNKFHVIDGDHVYSSLAVFDTANYMVYSCLHNLKQYAYSTAELCGRKSSLIVQSQVHLSDLVTYSIFYFDICEIRAAITLLCYHSVVSGCGSSIAT